MNPTNRDAGSLAVGFVGDHRSLRAGEDLTFGRSADLVIDENQFMHRVVGRFVCREAVWWLQNLGTRSRLQLMDTQSGTLLEMAPGQQLPIVAPEFVVRFTAGPTNYEIVGSRSGDALRADGAGEVFGTATVDFAAVPLSPEQHLLVVCLFESRLRTGRIEGGQRDGCPARLVGEQVQSQARCRVREVAPRRRAGGQGRDRSERRRPPGDGAQLGTLQRSGDPQRPGAGPRCHLAGRRGG